jgi:hypothetical protein
VTALRSFSRPIALLSREGLGHPGLLGSAETRVDFSIPEPKGRSSRKCPDGQGQAALWDAGRSGLGLPRSGGDRAPSKVLIWPNQFAFPSSVEQQMSRIARWNAARRF